MLLAMVFLLLLIVGALTNPFWFGLAGTGVFVWNTLGFSWIRRHVVEAVREARALYEEQEPPRRELLLRALKQIETHWSLKRTRWYSDRQQIRHITLAVAFVIVSILAALGEMRDSAILKMPAYWIGGTILIVAEVWIAIWRSTRDLALLRIREQLRS